jgi:hypothetical protein
MAVIYSRANPDMPKPTAAKPVRKGEPTQRRLIPRLFRLIALLSAPEGQTYARLAQALEVVDRTVKRDVAFLRSIGLTIDTNRALGSLRLNLPASAITDVGQALYNMAGMLAMAVQASNPVTAVPTVSTPPPPSPPAPNPAQLRRRQLATEHAALQEAILACARRHTVVTRATIIADCRLAPAAATVALRRLCQDGILARQGETRGTTYRLAK